ncbi:hypothetical protein D9F30_23500 [Escherichia coli]|nr:hypothetical protein [Escherichia coli]
MSCVTHLISMDEIDINVNDPRNNGDFLILSHAIDNYNAYLNDGAYWLTLEKRCLSLIKQFGYDLQTGVWLCLIETKVHGWDGLAFSSLLFSKFLAKKDPQCWPGADFAHIRHQIIDWYGNNVFSAIDELKRTDLRSSTRAAMIKFLEIFLQQSVVLESIKCSEFKKLLCSMKLPTNNNGDRQYNMDKNDYSEKNNKDKLQNCLSCGHKKNSSLVPVMFFLAGVTITYAVNFINQPKTAWRLDAMLPGNVFSSYALGECSDNIDDEPWINLKRQIDDFEFRIKDVESKGGYLTLSEIKTLVHKMQIGILQIEKPLSSQLNSIYNKIINGEEIEPLSLEIINDRVRKINCTLSGIHAELDS